MNSIQTHKFGRRGFEKYSPAHIDTISVSVHTKLYYYRIVPNSFKKLCKRMIC